VEGGISKSSTERSAVTFALARVAGRAWRECSREGQSVDIVREPDVHQDFENVSGRHEEG